MASHYPNGIKDLILRDVPINQLQSGTVFWVNNSTVLAKGGIAGSNNNNGSYQQPFSTIDYAIGRMTPERGDIVVVMPDHAEDVSAAGGITLDVVGGSVIGLGSGANRPTITMSNTASSIAISAASTTFQNFIVTPSVDSVVSPVVISAADVWVDYEHRDASSAIEAVRAILTTAAADNLNINLKYSGFTAGNAVVNAVRLVGANNANVNVDFYGVASTSVVEFHTTACTNVTVKGNFYNSGTTNGSKDVVDTVTGSTWYAEIEDSAAGAVYRGGSASALASDDISTVAANQTVPTADSTANVLERDVVGNKTDAAAVGAVGTTKSLMAYAKQAVTEGIATTSSLSTITANQAVPTADVTTNTLARDVSGNKTDASVYVPGTTKSLAAYAKGAADLQQRVAVKAAAVMVNNDTLFTVAGGPISVLAIWSECVTANDATASTLQYSATPTVGSAQTLSGASASIASAAAGASVSLIGTALSTAALYNASGPNLGMSGAGSIIVPAGTIKAVVGVGSTTGTWRHYIRYMPLAVGVTVS